MIAPNRKLTLYPAVYYKNHPEKTIPFYRGSSAKYGNSIRMKAIDCTMHPVTPTNPTNFQMTYFYVNIHGCPMGLKPGDKVTVKEILYVYVKKYKTTVGITIQEDPTLKNLENENEGLYQGIDF